MHCSRKAEGQAVTYFDREEQLLGVDAGMIAIVDEASIDDFLTAVASLVDGRDSLGLPGFARFGNGFLYDTGSDGGFAHAAYVTGSATIAVEIGYDLYEETDRWIPAGIFPVPSGVAVLGDPGSLADYVPDPFDPPAAALGAWTVLALPRPGWLTIHICKEHGRADHTNLALRAEWLPGVDSWGA